MQTDNATGPRRDLLFPGLLLLAGLVLNLVRLGHWAPLPDEVNYALCARSLVENRTAVSPDIMFFPPLFVYLSALLQLLGLEALLSVRLISAVGGALVLPLLYHAASACYPTRTARLASLAALPLFALHSYSRLGQVEVLMLALLSAAFVFLVKSAQNREPRHALAAGLFLGAALWCKETALGAVACSLLLVLVTPGNRGRRLGLLLLGWAVPALLLVGLGALSGSNLLLEVTAGRGYDINMQRLSPFANVLVTGANLGYNLFPRLFTRWEFAAFALLVPLLIIILLVLTVRGSLARRAFPLLVACYLAVHLPFFVVFSRKFDYYLLPAAVLLLITGAAEALTAGSTERRPSPWLRAATVLVAVLALLNVGELRFLFWNEGTHASFRSEVLRLPPSSVVASSHPTLARYVGERAGRGLMLKPLFRPGSYDLDWQVLNDTTVRFVVMKRNYRDILQQQARSGWDSLAVAFPSVRDVVDPAWSLWAARDTPEPSGVWDAVAPRLQRLVRPTGVVVLGRAASALP